MLVKWPNEILSFTNLGFPEIAGVPWKPTRNQKATEILWHLICLGFTHIHTTLGSCHGVLRLERRRCLQALKNGGL